MTTRLVLGVGSLGRPLVDDLAERRGSLTIVTDDEHRIDTLRADGITVVARDPTDRSVLDDLDVAPDTVIVACDDPERNRSLVETAAAVFPAAFLLAYTGRAATTQQRDRIAAAADEVVDRDD